jgi:predicted acyltransferase
MQFARIMQRNQSLDAYRGSAMLLMMAEVLHLPQIAKAIPESPVWAWLAAQQSHVAWVGCSLHDLIQPSFSFLVGAALPYSLAARQAAGQSERNQFAHALWRSLLLVMLGIFLRSTNRPMTNFTFDDTLTQIGLGYPFLFLLGRRPPKWAWIFGAVILVGCWLAWMLYPLLLTGSVADAWVKHKNLGAAFDLWWMNLFPRPAPFTVHGGGYTTLNFLPTLATMILGLIAGRWLRSEVDLRRFVVAGAVGVAAGLFLQASGLCPIVKRIWTPAWVLFSGGLCVWILAGFHWLIEVKGWRRWAFPLVVVGMNSIAAYFLAHLSPVFLGNSLTTHLGTGFLTAGGADLEPLVKGSLILLSEWLILLWMHQRKIFLRV